MKGIIRKVATVGALSLLALTSQAKVVTIDEVVDATTVRDNWNSLNTYAGGTFTLAVGDTLDVHLSFLPGQALSLVDPQWIEMMASSDATNMFETSLHNTLMLTGLQGSGINSVASDGTTYGGGVMAAFFPSDFMDGSSNTISFTGAEFRLTIVDMPTEAQSRLFSGLYFYTNAASASAVSAVPEPASAALLIAGLGALVAQVRLRRRNCA